VVKEQTTVASFGTVPDFESKLSASLGKLLVEKLGTEEDKKHIEAGGRLIPVAPTPYIAHPYPLPEHFTGRQAEKSMLSTGCIMVESQCSCWRPSAAWASPPGLGVAP